MKNSALFFTKVLRLLSLTLFLSFLFSTNAHAYSPDYFGVTSADLSGANVGENQEALDALGMKHTYTWGGGSSYPSGSNNIQLVMLRLGSTWWKTQGFTPKSATLADNGSFTVNNYLYEYNRKAIEDKVTALKGYIANQPVRYYVIGNEINNDHADGDGAVPSTQVTSKQKFQAYQFKIIYDIIKQKDPTAKIVAPSVVGFTTGMNDGISWYNTFLSEYQNMYGPLPIDVLNHHAYDTYIYEKGTFNKATNINEPYQRRTAAQEVINDLKSFREWADGKGWSNLPIFITEFGVPTCEYPNGQDIVCWNIDDDPNNQNPQNTTNSAITTAYLDKLINGFKRYQNKWKLQKWFLFGQRDQWRDYDGDHVAETLVQDPVVLLNYDGSGNFTSLTTIGTWYKNKSLEQTFADVPPSHVHYAKIESDYNNGYIDHCGTPSDIGTMNFCPNDGTSRAVMARWLVWAMHQTQYFPSPSFSDVPTSHPDFGSIERIKQLQITAGCGNGQYCPTQTVLRQEMAKFISLAKGWTPYTPPQNDFTDVTDPNHWAYGYIYRMKEKNVTNGCQTNPLKYCPLTGIGRADMGAFIFNANF